MTKEIIEDYSWTKLEKGFVAFIILTFLSALLSMAFGQIEIGDSLSLVLDEVIVDDSGNDLPADSTYYNLFIEHVGSLRDTIFFRRPSSEINFESALSIDGAFIPIVGDYDRIYNAVLKVSANPSGEVWRDGEADILKLSIIERVEPVVSSFSPSVAREGEAVSVTGSRLSGALQVLVGSTSASVFGVTETALSFLVPTGAEGGRITIVFRVDGEIMTASSVESLTVERPLVTRRPGKATITIKTGN